jgi:YVTN family beta-propeller protein
MPNRPSLTVALLGLVAAAAWCTTLHAQAVPSYRITKTIALGPPDRWDYLTFDQDSHRVYIAHGDRVTVVDGRGGAIVGRVEGFPGGTHGIAIVSALGRGYTDDGKAGTVTSFNLSTLKPLHTIKAAPGADGVVFDKASGHVFVINGDSGSVTVIDPSKDAASTTVAMGGGLEFGVVDGFGKLYVDGAEKREIVRLDTKTSTVDAHWPIPACAQPRGIAIDPATHRVFASCANGVVVVVDTDTGANVATVPIGLRTDAAAFDAKRKLIFSSNGDGTLSVIAEKGPNEFVSLGSVATMLGARTMTIDPESGRIYLVAAQLRVNVTADPSDIRHRYLTVPGSAKLLFLDPEP